MRHGPDGYAIACPIRWQAPRKRVLLRFWLCRLAVRAVADSLDDRYDRQAHQGNWDRWGDPKRCCVNGTANTDHSDSPTEKLTSDVTSKNALSIFSLRRHHFIPMSDVSAGGHILDIHAMCLLALSHSYDSIGSTRDELVVLEEVLRCGNGS